MSESAATLRMTVPEFLRWDDGTETPYELVNGRPVAMSPAADPHGTIAGNAFVEVDRLIERRRPCRAAVEAGVWINDREYYAADVLATCKPAAADGIVREPFLIVEVLSTSNDDAAFRRKIAAYTRLPWVQEIWLIEGRERSVQQWRRAGPDRWIVTLPLTGRATFESPALGGTVALDRLYRNTGLEPAEVDAGALADPGGGP